MIIWIASYPRSGNTFFRHVLHELYGVSTYSKYTDDVIVSSGIGKEIGHAPEQFISIESNHKDKLCFVKTHDLPEDDSPAVYIIRNGLDAVVSHAMYMHAHEKQMYSVDELLREIITGATWGGWSGNVRGWYDRLNTVVIRFEDLINCPVLCARYCMNVLDIKLAEIEPKVMKFAELHEKWPDFFVKGQEKPRISSELSDLFMKHHGDMMERLHYETHRT